MIFPIAGVELCPLLPVLLGLAIGTLAGVFGIGGGVLATPALMWAGVPPAAAVGTGLNQMIAASAIGTMLNVEAGRVRPSLALFAACASLPAGFLGTLAAGLLIEGGYFGVVVASAYVLILVAVGFRMLRELWTAGSSHPAGDALSDAGGVAVVVLFSLLAGLFAGLLGVGGGFILVPVMIYLVGIGTRVAIGTSLMQILLISCGATVFHATFIGGVDVMLAAMLMVGSIPGSWLGVALARRLPVARLRGLFGLLLLLAAARMGWEIFGAAPAAQPLPAQAGAIGSAIELFAGEKPLLYGLSAAAFALVAGGLAGFVVTRAR